MPAMSGIKVTTSFLLLLLVCSCWLASLPPPSRPGGNAPLTVKPGPLQGPRERRLAEFEEVSDKEEAASGKEEAGAVREETVDLPFGEHVTGEVPLVDHSPGIGTQMAAVLAVTFLLLQSLTCVLCSYFGCNAANTAMPNLRDGYETLGPQSEEHLSEARQQSRLEWEAAISLALPWLYAGIGMLWVSTEGSTPPFWLFLILSTGGFIRAALLEFTLRKRCDQGPMKAWDILAFLASKLDVQDAAGDGLAVAAAASLPASAHERFVLSFAKLPSLQWLVHNLGLAGVVAAALAYATWLQAMLVILAGTGVKGGRAVLADMAGLGALARGMLATSEQGGEQEDSAPRVFILALTKVLAEAAPQALSQTSLLMAASESILEQPVVLVSVLLSLTVMLVQVKEAVRGACLVQKWGVDALFYRAGATGLVLVILSVCAYCLTKLYMTEVCKGRLWGISGGCIE